IARNRTIVACNHMFARIFRGVIADMVGQTFERLYPTQSDFEKTGTRVGEFLSTDRTFTDDRVMRRLDGDLFWVRVRGFTYTPEDPHANTLWVFTELAKTETPGQSLRTSLTPRERDIAALLIEGKTGKEIGRSLNISPRTVDVYRTRLLRKYNVSNTEALVQLLLQG
uniref:LuxR family transcriptional regulator n=1 Tax=Ensifer aridi TaxID=1708715 RepID=UPI000A105928